MGYGQYCHQSRTTIFEALATEWHGGQWSGLYAFQCGARDRDTLDRAATEFEQCAELAETSDERARLRVAALYCEHFEVKQ